MHNEGQILAMYDVRGIQNYIYRTPKLKDAIGASYIVETIIQKALLQVETEVRKTPEFENITFDFEWENDDGIIEYTGNDADIQVLYIGGGNAYIMYSSKELCVYSNKIMSKYVLEQTYSLQLAIAICEKTDNYAENYKIINSEMNRIKADMSDSRPIGTLPVMNIEYQTGLPSVNDEEDGGLSRETKLKREAEDEVRPKHSDSESRKFDSYINEKGVDSTLAVVHIDGNNMGLRIRNLIAGETDYVKAVNLMRNISHNINYSYKNVFRQMQEKFNDYINPDTKSNDYYVLKVLTAGDDITYVCNGQIAVATVEYFSREISKYCMNAGMEGEDIAEYGFSVCAGISFIRSHFPFSIGYEVAEACCDSAKSRAKKIAGGGKVGNFFDFQFCKNVQTKDIDEIRASEYMTPSGELLMIRPYGFESGDFYDFKNLKESVLWFLDKENIPRSFAKQLRNTYPCGRREAEQFMGFLNSRNWKLPGVDKDRSIASDDLYLSDDVKTYAKYYDALELMDDYLDLDVIEGRSQRND